jgi:hypothetical protein
MAGWVRKMRSPARENDPDSATAMKAWRADISITVKNRIYDKHEFVLFIYHA